VVKMSKRLILASASPRRRELLALLGLPFEVVPGDIDEIGPFDLTPRRLAEQLALEKARQVSDRLFGGDWRWVDRENPIVIGADTLVVSERTDPPAILGKPADADEARRMLNLLSGSTHDVYTGLAVVWQYWPDEADGFDMVERTEVVDTQVQFRELTPAMIDAYIATGEPFDKAGAYGIQGHAAAFVEAIYGDYFNVVGLPVQTVGRMLERIGIEWWRGEKALD
jgi:septum formation protein